jgi:hypothetical protein
VWPAGAADGRVGLATAAGAAAMTTISNDNDALIALKRRINGMAGFLEAAVKKALFLYANVNDIDSH